jgi:hypothetical protein
MSATVKHTNKQKPEFEECQVAPKARPVKGHLTLEIKMANEIIHDYMEQAVPPFL